MYGVASGVHMPVHTRINARVCWLLLHWPKTQPYELPRAINELGSVNKAVCTDLPSTRRYETVTLLGLSFMMCSIHQLDSILRMV